MGKTFGDTKIKSWGDGAKDPVQDARHRFSALACAS